MYLCFAGGKKLAVKRGGRIIEVVAWRVSTVKQREGVQGLIPEALRVV